MKILVTGSNGFVGKNLIAELNNIIQGKTNKYAIDNEIELLLFDVDTDLSLLSKYTAECDFVFHLAGVNRPDNEEEFMKGNFGFTSQLLECLKRSGNKATVVATSSIQAVLDNPYGKSKKAGEDLIFDYGNETGAKVIVYRFPNVFGKWCRPNYNSAIATFCNNIASGKEITVNDRNTDMKLVYIDDLVEELIHAIIGEEHIIDGFAYVPRTHNMKLGEIVDLIYSFKESRKDLSVPKLDNNFQKALYSTYLSYLPVDEFSYPLKMNQNERGSFTEIIRTLDCGQFSVNIIKAGITKGNHWHHTKNEKFVVVSGKALIRFRKIGSDKIIDYHVSGDSIQVVDIPTGYTHSIANVGDTDLVTFMWCNECFDPENPDTYYEEV